MTSESPQEFTKPPVSRTTLTTVDGPEGERAGNKLASDDVRLRDVKSGTAPADAAERNGEAGAGTSDEKKAKAPRKEVSEAKIKLQARLPALEDDADIGVEKEQVVTRDGKADLSFTGTLLASAAPDAAAKGHWQELRIYQTSGGKHVFSKVSRTVFAEEKDTYEADVFDPAPSSVPSQLIRGARELARSKPVTWMDAAVAFFGYEPLAKVLYRKLSVRFEEQIS